MRRRPGLSRATLLHGRGSWAGWSRASRTRLRTVSRRSCLSRFCSSIPILPFTLSRCLSIYISISFLFLSPLDLLNHVVLLSYLSLSIYLLASLSESFLRLFFSLPHSLAISLFFSHTHKLSIYLSTYFKFAMILQEKRHAKELKELAVFELLEDAANDSSFCR